MSSSSLRAAQRLSSNFHMSLEVARGLLQKLREWYNLLPPSLRLQNRLFTTIDQSGPQSNCLHFAYLFLEVLIFRSLLRPMVRSAEPPRLFEESEDPTTFTNLVDDYITQIIEAEEVEPVPAIDMSEEHGVGNAVLKAAENCAAKMLRSVMRMACSDLAGFWYSCRFPRRNIAVSFVDFVSRVAHRLRHGLEFPDAVGGAGAIKRARAAGASARVHVAAGIARTEPGMRTHEPGAGPARWTALYGTHTELFPPETCQGGAGE